VAVDLVDPLQCGRQTLLGGFNARLSVNTDLAEIIDDHICAACVQGLFLIVAINSDHAGKMTELAGLDTRQRIFDHGGPLRPNTELPGGCQKYVRRRFAGQVLFGRIPTVDDSVEQVLNSSRFKDGPAIFQ
jgi:hypothetical protein